MFDQFCKEYRPRCDGGVPVCDGQLEFTTAFRTHQRVTVDGKDAIGTIHTVHQTEKKLKVEFDDGTRDSSIPFVNAKHKEESLMDLNNAIQAELIRRENLSLSEATAQPQRSAFREAWKVGTRVWYRRPNDREWTTGKVIINYAENAFAKELGPVAEKSTRIVIKFGKYGKLRGTHTVDTAIEHIRNTDPDSRRRRLPENYDSLRPSEQALARQSLINRPKTHVQVLEKLLEEINRLNRL